MVGRVMFRNSIRNFINKFQKFMYGRYGQDSLNRFLSFVSLALCVLSFFIHSVVIVVAILTVFVLIFFRTFSKNFTRRRRENQIYTQAAKPVMRFFKYWFTRIKLHKTHFVYSCAECGSILRVPRSAGYGKIEIKCPKCHASFTKRISGGGGSAGKA